MFLPILIVLLTLSPVLIPAVVTVFHLAANRREARRRRDIVSRDIKPGVGFSARTSATEPVRLTIRSIGREPLSTAPQPA